jgi:hypothetical protein
MVTSVPPAMTPGDGAIEDTMGRYRRGRGRGGTAGATSGQMGVTLTVRSTTLPSARARPLR